MTKQTNKKVLAASMAGIIAASGVATVAAPALDASAATAKYKFDNGVLKKNGKVFTGSYKSGGYTKYYVKGVPLTGLKGSILYKDGFRDQGYSTYKGKVYKDGKKVPDYYQDKEEGTLKYLGKTFTGKYKGKMYKSGRLAAGTIDGITYYEGKAVNNNVFLGVYYQKGKPFTGVGKVKGGAKQHFVNGLPSNGLVVVKGVTYYDSYIVDKYAIQGIFYIKGKVFTGIYNDIYYKDGKAGTGTYKGIYYQQGEAFTGLARLDNDLSKPAYYWVDGKKFTGTGPGGQVFKNGITVGSVLDTGSKDHAWDK